MVGIMVLGVLRSPKVDEVGVVAIFIGLRSDDRGVVAISAPVVEVKPVPTPESREDPWLPDDVPPGVAVVPAPVADPSKASRFRLL